MIIPAEMIEKAYDLQAEARLMFHRKANDARRN